MRNLYDDMLDRLLVNVNQMKEIDYSKQNTSEQDELIKWIVSYVRSLSCMLHKDKMAEIQLEVDAILENILASISLLRRDVSSHKEVLYYQLPFFVWNLKYLISQHICKDKKSYISSLKSKFESKYNPVFKEQKLIICLHLDGSIQNLEKAIICANIIKNVVEKVDLITIAESTAAASWLDKISNAKRLHIFWPLKGYFIPPYMCNGEYVLDIPKGAVCSDSLPKMIIEMLKNNHDFYRDEQGIKLAKTMNEILPYFEEAK